MEKLTLREAAEHSGLSITTLRRYIRSGKLTAVKSQGRYGPEYCMTPEALEEAGAPLPAWGGNGEEGLKGRAAHAGLSAARAGRPASRTPVALSATVAESVLREMIPIDLYRELAMKHEQILVQYGMVRVGGQRLMEYKAQAEQLAETLRGVEEAAEADRERYERDASVLQQHVRQAELALEEKAQELTELREKVRILELIGRNAVTTETIERQFLQVFDKKREIGELQDGGSDERRRKTVAPILESGHRAEPTDQ